MTKRKNNKKCKSQNENRIEKSQLNSKKKDSNRKVVVHSESDRILRSNNNQNIALSVSESETQMKVKKRKNDALESSGIFSTRANRSKRANETEFVDEKKQEFSSKKPNNMQCDKIEKSSRSSSVSCKQINFKRNDICFAKLTGHLPWPAQILEISDDKPYVVVYFFGDYTLGRVFKSRLFDFETYYKESYEYDATTNNSKKAALRHKAVLETLIHLGLH